MQSLSHFIQSQIPVSEDTLSIILTYFKERTVEKDGFVLRQGQVAADYFFVKSGGLRIYFDAQDKQVTGWFAFENEFFAELSSLKSGQPSRFTIQAVEKTELLTISHQHMEQLYRRFPEWQQFGRQLWETAFLKVLDGILTYQTMTAEERYLYLLQQSDLVQRVPLHQLSFYLGITPNSLSRLRKNIR